MARIGIVFGLMLCGLTTYGLIQSTEKSATQFVPMMFGIPLLFLGVVALNPHRRRIAMAFAGTLGAMGCVIAAVRLLILSVHSLAGRHVNPQSVQLVTAMALVCFVFAVLAGLWYFRRRRTPL